jgi:hypothetical protein
VRAITRPTTFAGILDGAVEVVFLDAYADTVRSFAPWTTAVTVADFRSTIATWIDFPDLLEVPEHGEYVSGSPFGPAVVLAWLVGVLSAMVPAWFAVRRTIVAGLRLVA